SYWNELGNNEYSCSDLFANLRKYKWNDYLFNMEYKKKSETPLSWCLIFEEEAPLIKLAIKLFSIMPSQAGYKRNFSILG
ncbi:42171_t:CDS:1, partial [Gigaspora margarita]